MRDLARYLESGCKPPAAYKIGTEHEAFGFFRDTFAPPPYRPENRPGIRDLLLAAEREGLSPILDGDNIIGLKGGGASLSLEPGGQFELSGAMLASLHETKAELEAHVARIHRIATPLGLGFAPLGFHPAARREDMPFMPKGRYKIMRDYMPKVGTLGLDMMLRTCTVQVNLDFSSEADMVTKLRVGFCLQPLATALFANSPFYEGKPNGLLSNRAQVWTDTDNARAGIPEIVFLEGFGFEAYANWLADVPMYFVYRDSKFVDVAGGTRHDWRFRRSFHHRIPGCTAQTLYRNPRRRFRLGFHDAGAIGVLDRDFLRCRRPGSRQTSGAEHLLRRAFGDARERAASGPGNAIPRRRFTRPGTGCGAACGAGAKGEGTQGRGRGG
jgi:glutamate--cysteine ligase